MKRLTNNLNARSSRAPPLPTAGGNPNSYRTVFDVQSHESKRRKIDETSSSRQPEPFRLSKRGLLGGPIDLTGDDAEVASYSSTDSEDPLNLGAEERSKSKARIVRDGPFTRRLRTDHRGGESSKVVDSDPHTGPIQESASKGKVRGFVHIIEGGQPPKLQLNSENPLDSLSPASRKPKVRLFIEEEG